MSGLSAPPRLAQPQLQGGNHRRDPARGTEITPFPPAALEISSLAPRRP